MGLESSQIKRKFIEEYSRGSGGNRPCGVSWVIPYGPVGMLEGFAQRRGINC